MFFPHVHPQTTARPDRSFPGHEVGRRCDEAPQPIPPDATNKLDIHSGYVKIAIENGHL
jgi:hypothetical protein